MIITQLRGGLGNQMFQYATGKSLALKTEQEHKLDIRELIRPSTKGTDTPRSFALHACNITDQLAEDHDTDSMRYRGTSTFWRYWRALRMKTGPYGPSCYRERNTHFDPGLFRVKGDAYLIGYWQSYKYFEESAVFIRKAFTPDRPLSEASLSYCKKIGAVNAVSVHVRRGDYVTNPTANSFHGTCDLRYYRDAVQAVGSRLKKPHYFIFSDDLEWAKKHLNFVQPATFVEYSVPVHEFEELHLMSRCHHNIIANSSFSWWGAWLNDHPSRVIVAPQRWFRDPRIDTKDLIPCSWIRL